MNEMTFLNNQHILQRGEKYKKDFENILQRIRNEYGVDAFNETIAYINLKIIDRLSDDQYIQAVAEIVLYLRYKIFGFSPKRDVRLVQNSKKDIDIQISHEALRLNFEVKSPKQDVHEDGKFHASVANRHPDVSKEGFDGSIQDLSHIIQEASGIETQVMRLKDDTLADFINNANQKFCNRTADNLNILFVAVDSNRMSDFMRYLFNHNSGIFVNNIVKTVNSENIDCIAISNIIDGHKLGATFAFNVFDLNNFVNLYFPVPQNEKIENQENTNSFFGCSFPNKNNEFVLFEKIYLSELKTRDNGIEESAIPFIAQIDELPSYLSRFYPCFALNRDDSIERSSL